MPFLAPTATPRRDRTSDHSLLGLGVNPGQYSLTLRSPESPPRFLTKAIREDARTYNSNRPSDHVIQARMAVLEFT